MKSQILLWAPFCTNPICDIKRSCLNQSECGVWPRVFQLIYGVHLAAPNQGEPGLNAVFKQCQYTQNSATAMGAFGTRAIRHRCPFCVTFMWLLGFQTLPVWSSRTLP